MRSAPWQQRCLLAAGLGCGKGAAAAVLAAGSASEVLPGGLLVRQTAGCLGLALGDEEAEATSYPVAQPMAIVEMCAEALQDPSSWEIFLWRPSSSLRPSSCYKTAGGILHPNPQLQRVPVLVPQWAPVQEEGSWMK